eukprot:7462610-Ditylum_brightwellii.AAC.1
MLGAHSVHDIVETWQIKIMDDIHLNPTLPSDIEKITTDDFEMFYINLNVNSESDREIVHTCGRLAKSYCDKLNFWCEKKLWDPMIDVPIMNVQKAYTAAVTFYGLKYMLSMDNITSQTTQAVPHPPSFPTVPVSPKDTFTEEHISLQVSPPLSHPTVHILHCSMCKDTICNQTSINLQEKES